MERTRRELWQIGKLGSGNMGLRTLLDKQMPEKTKEDELMDLIRRATDKIDVLEGENKELKNHIVKCEKLIERQKILLSTEDTPEITELKNRVLLEQFQDAKEAAENKLKNTLWELQRVKQDFADTKEELNRAENKLREETKTKEELNTKHNKQKSFYRYLFMSYVVLSLVVFILGFLDLFGNIVFFAWVGVNLVGFGIWNFIEDRRV